MRCLGMPATTASHLRVSDVLDQLDYNGSRFGKVSSGAAFTFVNMESEKSCFAFPRQTGKPRHNQHASVLLVKLNASG